MKKLFDKTQKASMDYNDAVRYAYIMSSDGLTEGKVQLSDITEIPETARTINFDNSMTATDINDIISTEVGRLNSRLPSSTIIFQFADGTYTLDGQLNFKGFYGDGYIAIQGNSSDPESLTTAQSVHLNFNNSSHGINVDKCSSFMDFKHLKITTMDGYRGLNVSQCKFARARWGYFISTAKTSTNTRSINTLAGTNLLSQLNYFSGAYFGIFAERASQVYTDADSDTGTQPSYGLRAHEGAIVAKSASSSITGSISDDTISTGGIIRP